MPPVLAAANAKTRTPNRSSRCLTPAIAPLSAKTKVPTRSSTSRSVLIPGSPSPNRPTRLSAIPGRPDQAAWQSLWRQPSARRDDQGLDTGLQGRMDNRRKVRIVVGRDLIEPARLPGFRVALGVGAADEPEHGGRVPF